MIKHIIFDFGNVILNIHPRWAMESFATQSQVPNDKIREFYLSDLHMDFMRGKYSPEEFYQKMFAQYQFDLSMDDFCSIWNQVVGEPKEGIVELIDQLSAKFTLSICSNTDQIHWDYCLKRFSFLNDNFQHYFLSFEMQHDKPDLAVFRFILKELKTVGEKCLFIDDTYQNVEAAQKSAFHTIHSEEPGKIRKELIRLNLL